MNKQAPGNILRRMLPAAQPRPTGEEPRREIEARWPVTGALLIVVLLYASLPDRLTFGPPWLAPIVEFVLLVPLLLTQPHWHPQAGWRWQRVVAVTLIGVINVSNLASLVLLVDTLLHGFKATGAELILEAAKIWLTNIVVFALWYWELDRGGPRARHSEQAGPPDFLFPQMTSPEVAPAHWMPIFVDYFYVAFTNATAFSPTDTLPLTPPAKLLMSAQSLISLLTLALVAARAVNILT
ncbi:MAG: hypothetical protein ACR2M0_08305 [Chloroflexia bacterium]